MSLRTFTAAAIESRHTGEHRHTIVPRLVAGLPLLFIGIVHAVDPDLRMDPLVDAAGIPLASIVAPLAVAAEILAGLALILGAYARYGAAIAIPTMVVAIFAHLSIGEWPNGAENEPPIALPVLVLACAAYVLWRGSGRWSVDRWLDRTRGQA